MELIPFYNKRQKQFSDQAAIFRKTYERYTLVRLISFILGALVVVGCFSVSWLMGGIATILFLAAFARFVFWHQQLLKKEKFQADLAQINEDELTALSGDWSHFKSGENYINPEHPYAVDLDIFGLHSLFQFTNRTVTSIGDQRLAHIFESPEQIETIHARQEAIAELTELRDWSHYFQAIGKETTDAPEDLAKLKLWLTDPYIILGNKGLIAAMYWVPISMIILFALPTVWVPFSFKIMGLLVPLYFYRKRLKPIGEQHERTAKAEKILGHYAQLIGQVEQQDFSSDLLKSIKKPFFIEGGTASLQLKKLSKIIAQLNVRYNAFSFLLEIFGMWSFHYTHRLEKWKSLHKDQLLLWFDSLAKMDALISLGTLRFNHPTWVFPTIERAENAFNGQAIGHPLLDQKQRVDNDLFIPGNGYIKLITGSNMAGKSTFLRSVGLSIVMGMTGMPVCARSLQFPPFHVYTSMRTQDALHESTSSFFAELKRLKFIIEAVESGKPIFFLLDEILKGTNSTDRHKGSKALLLQLIRDKGTGLVATHDLMLGNLETQYPSDIENLCFEVDVIGEDLQFDYKVKKGISQSLNATILMRKMGIDV